MEEKPLGVTVYSLLRNNAEILSTKTKCANVTVGLAVVPNMPVHLTEPNFNLGTSTADDNDEDNDNENDDSDKR